MFGFELESMVIEDFFGHVIEDFLDSLRYCVCFSGNE